MSIRPKCTAAILAFFLIICFTFSWLFSHVFSENARFENFAESIFEKEVSGNALNLHYSLAYPEKQGISRPRATLGTIPVSYTHLDVYKRQVSAFYGKREFSVGKLLLHENISPDQQFRDFPLENSVLDQTMEWLPYYDPDFDVLHCNHDEELSYQIMESGTAALMELGEVRCV